MLLFCFFGWLGEENAPEIVRYCIKSIRCNAGSHPVNIVTEENYLQFTDIPKYVIEKMQVEKITLTHFSDILRMNLIANNGGLWLDATIFCSQKMEGH